jgi:hypothetical protein
VSGGRRNAEASPTGARLTPCDLECNSFCRGERLWWLEPLKLKAGLWKGGETAARAGEGRRRRKLQAIGETACDPASEVQTPGCATPEVVTEIPVTSRISLCFRQPMAYATASSAAKSANIRGYKKGVAKKIISEYFRL